jgi:RNA polymerase sigma factor (sigma-70 family)
LVMIELVLGIDRFRGQCSLDAWVSVVTAHLVFKHLRSKKRDRLVFSALGEAGSPGYSVPTSSSGRLAVTRELLRRLSSLLQSLDSAKAEVFVLHEVHGFDLKEVSEILGITVANAQTRLVRGRKALHELIAHDVELKTALDELGDEP